MKIKEITENHITNSHMGMGSERAPDQRILERPRNRRRERKLKDNTAFGMGDKSAGGNWANTGAQFKQM